MMISTRGRYALRVLVDLAENSKGEFVPMRDIAKRQGISLKYLERIIPVLAKNSIVEGLQGKGGGYRLIKSPAECKVGDILRLTEGDLAPVACLKKNAARCERSDTCKTYSLWVEFYQTVNDFFDGKTLSDLVNSNNSRNAL